MPQATLPRGEHGTRLQGVGRKGGIGVYHEPADWQLRSRRTTATKGDAIERPGAERKQRKIIVQDRVQKDGLGGALNAAMQRVALFTDG